MSGKLGVVIGLIIGFLVCGIGAVVGVKMAKDEFDSRLKAAQDAAAVDKDLAFRKGLSEGTDNSAKLLEESIAKPLREENEQLKKKIAELEKK